MAATENNRSSPSPDPMEPVYEQLREQAQYDSRRRIPLDQSGLPHDIVLRQVLRNILATEVALETLAQIVDGLPVADVLFDSRYPVVSKDDDPIEEHMHVCLRAVEKNKSLIKDGFDVSALTFAPALVASYLQSEAESEYFNVLLIELVACSIHQIAVHLFHQDFRLHTGPRSEINRVTNYVQRGHLKDNRIMLFSHPMYTDIDIYPNGAADAVGYWAESRIFGGVVVFDRKDGKTNPPEPTNVYLHSFRCKSTIRVYQLTDDQQSSLVNFLTFDDEVAPVQLPLPLLATKINTIRCDEWRQMVGLIYRDVWERKPPTRQHIQFMERRPRSVNDYPSELSLLKKMNRLQTNNVKFSGPASEQSDAAIFLNMQVQDDN